MKGFAAVVLVVACLANHGISIVHAATKANEGKVTQKMIDRFHEWVDERITRTGVEVGEGVAGRGIMATKQLHEDDAILQVPLNWVVCRDTAEHYSYKGTEKSSERQIRRAFTEITNDEDLVAAFIMRETALGEKSAWHAYMEVLPRHVPLPIFFDSNELKAFESPTDVMRAKQQKAQYKARYKTALPKIRQLINTKLNEFSDVSDVKKFQTFASYLWAISLVGSRALTLQGKKYLVPLADMYNYDPQDMEREANSGHHFLRYHKLNQPKGFFTITADRETPAGSELFSDYGDNDNALYLHHHGFVVDNNPFDCVHLNFPSVISGHGSKADKNARVSLLKELRMPPIPRHCIRPDKPLPPYVLQHMRIRGMDARAVQRCRASISNNPRRGSRSKECGWGAKLSKSAVKDVLKTVTKARNAYSTTYEEDKALLISVDAKDASLAVTLTGHERLAIRFRMSRKRLLGYLHTRFAGRSFTSSSAINPDAVSGSATAKNEEEAKRIEQDDIKKAAAFNKWVEENDFPINKLTVQPTPGMRLGTLASEDITAEEVYLAVPNSVIMSRDSARKSKGLKDVIAELSKDRPRGDAFHELLLHLMYEKYVAAENSFYAPFLAILPDANDMHFPAFYTSSELEELRGSDTLLSINQWKTKVKNTYKAIKTHVLSRFPEAFPDDKFTFANYKWAYAVLDSRSIWWHGQRHLVPLLDMINCIEGPNPARVHSTVNDEEIDSAVTKAPWSFKKGEQVFENYGQPNHIYFTYHGFLLDDNTHDCVRFDALLDIPKSDPERSAKLQMLKSSSDFGYMRNMIGREYSFCLRAPFKIDRELLAFIRIRDGLSTTSEARTALADECLLRLNRYKTSISEDESMLRKLDGNGQALLSGHRRTATKLRLSEKRLLKGIVRHLGGASQEMQASVKKAPQRARTKKQKRKERKKRRKRKYIMKGSHDEL